MADQLLDAQSAPTSPSAGQLAVFPVSSAVAGLKQFASKDENGRVLMMPGIINTNTADEVANAADTYLTGSALNVPPHLLQVGTIFKWRLRMSKTAAGTAAPIWVVRVGTLGTTGDAARLTFTQVALQTAAIDAGYVEIEAILRNVGAAGVLAGGLTLAHVLATTGFSTLGSTVLQVTSAGFDTTVASLIVGVSVNPGASGVWTHQLVYAEMKGI